MLTVEAFDDDIERTKEDWLAFYRTLKRFGKGRKRGLRIGN
jgi:hypothetical protein